ncbi:MAG: alpha/beta fold hydrolase, partial [Salinibacterium sp.]
METPSWLDSELYPFRSRFIEVPDARLHYIDEGEGPTLLLIHGNPTWSFLYRDVIRQLSTEFRCIAIDLPGFGLSATGDGRIFDPADHACSVAELIEQLDIRDYVLVAHDWGGPIGLAAALEAPERLAGLALGNTWAWPVADDPHFSRFSSFMGGPIGRFGARTINFIINAMLPAGHRRRRLSVTELRHYRAPMTTPRRRAATSRFATAIVSATPFLQQLEARLPEIVDRPALLLWADGDIAFRTKELDRWRSLLSQLRVIPLAGVGHFSPSDAPSEFSSGIR